MEPRVIATSRQVAGTTLNVPGTTRNVRFSDEVLLTERDES